MLVMWKPCVVCYMEDACPLGYLTEGSLEEVRKNDVK